MKVVDKQIIQYKTVYISNDGKEFDNEQSCKLHEFRCKAVKVYGVTKRGDRSDSMEIFSTKVFAQKSIDNIQCNKDLYYIVELFIDEGLLRNNND